MKKVCIIGGGPAGLASVKSLNLEPVAFEIDLYETRSKLGGVWNYYNDKTKYVNDDNIQQNNIHDYSPIYRDLETNIVRELMCFANVEFDTRNKFPRHFEVLSYINQYIQTIGSFNKYLNTKVINVVKIGDMWEVTSEDLINGSQSIKQYHGVIVANGHFDKPFIPNIPGLQRWMQQDSHSCIHAKFFDDIQLYKDKTVVVIGGSSSGSDIALHLSKVAKHIMVSVKQGDIFGNFDNASPFITKIPEITAIDYDRKMITLANHQQLHTDAIICATGYMYDVSFLNSPIGHDTYVSNIYQQMFYIPDTTLCFNGLLKNVKPFPMSELQGSVIARVLSNRLALPSQQDMMDDYHRELAASGSDNFHNFKTKQLDYIVYWQHLIKSNHLDQQGLNSPVFEGEKLELQLSSGDMKNHRILELNHIIVNNRLNR